MALYSVEGLSVLVETRHGWRFGAREVSYEIDAGECVALVGESGSGKSLMAMGPLDLLLPGTVRAEGTATFAGRRLDGMEDEERRRVMGTEIGVIFQDPVAASNPALTVGDQAAETLEEHEDLEWEGVRRRVLAALRSAQLSDPQKAAQRAYELSHGEAQRAMLAAALLRRPRLLIADEPVSALDVRLGQEVLEIVQEIRRTRGTAVLLVTHDLGVVARMADRVLVTYAGMVIEEGPTARVLEAPRHPYTSGLLAASPWLNRGRLVPIPGEPPDLAQLPPGCSFQPRCAHAVAACAAAIPAPRGAPGNAVRCVRADELILPGIRR